MAKRIAYCADGTWDTSTSHTNVYKLYKALIIRADQMAFYDDGVGASRDHPTGENPHRFALTDGLFERAAGRDLADHPEPRRDINCVGRSHRITVHRRHRLWRLGP